MVRAADQSQTPKADTRGNKTIAYTSPQAFGKVDAEFPTKILEVNEPTRAAIEEARARQFLPAAARIMPELGGVARIEHSHRVFMYGADVSNLVKSVRVREGLGEETEATIEFSSPINMGAFQASVVGPAPLGRHILDATSVIRYGALVQLSLFDGVAWRDFPLMKPIGVEENFDEEIVYSITCRSMEIDLHFHEESAVFRGRSDSDIVKLLARYLNLEPDVDETPLTYPERAIGEETLSEFMNHLAEEHGFEWGIEGKRLFFKKPRPIPHVVRLQYRPRDKRMGSIMSARFERNEDHKGGKDAEVKITYVNFETGEIDGTLVDETGSVADPYQVAKSPVTQLRKRDDPVKEAISSGEETGSYREVVGVRLDDEGIPGTLSPLFKGAVRKPTTPTAEAKEEAKDDKKDYVYTLTVKTYGQYDVKVSNLLLAEGLSVDVDGLWMITNIDHSYSPDSAWTMSITSKAPEKEDGSKGEALATPINKEEPQQAGGKVILLDLGASEPQLGIASLNSPPVAENEYP